MGSFLFTVFTPTYNRKATIGRVFESLLKQTLKDFEWLIVDDGSTDGTRELVEGWTNAPEVDFPIRYVWQENAHKKVAHNRAVKEATGELLLVFDSDDRCIPEALERFWAHWQAIPPESRKDFVGVCGLCQNEKGEIVGDYFPGGDYIDSDSLEMQYRYRVGGEKWGAMRTDVLRAYPFREDLPGLVPEGTVWGAIARTYRTRFFNEALRVYMQDVEGLIARSGQVVDPARNAVGAAYAKQQYLTHNVIYFRYSPVWFFLEAARLTRFWLQMPRVQRGLVRFWPESWVGRFLAVAASPLGVGMWVRDRWRWGKNKQPRDAS